MKVFRINHVRQNAPEGLSALLQANGLKSAVKKIKSGCDLRLPDGTYYVFEEGRYDYGIQITISQKDYDEKRRKKLC